MLLRSLAIAGTLIFFVNATACESHAQGWTWADSVLMETSNQYRAQYQWENSRNFWGYDYVDQELKNADFFFNHAYWSIQGAWASNNRQMYRNSEWYLLMAVREMEDAMQWIWTDMNSRSRQASRLASAKAYQAIKANRDKCLHLYHLAHITAGG